VQTEQHIDLGSEQADELEAKNFRQIQPAQLLKNGKIKPYVQNNSIFLRLTFLSIHNL